MTVLMVRLRGEDPQDVLAITGDASGALSRMLVKLDRATNHCLSYVDPWGLTIFNHLQMDVVISELERLMREPDAAPLVKVLMEIVELAVRCREEVHLYLEFEGD